MTAKLDCMNPTNKSTEIQSVIILCGESGSAFGGKGKEGQCISLLLTVGVDTSKFW